MNRNKRRFEHHSPSSPVLFSFKIAGEDRLLNFLYNHIQVIPRGKIKSMLEHHQVLVNGVAITRFDYLLSKEDIVKVVKKSFKDTRSNKLPFTVLYEDKDFIVVDKPSGLLTVASEKESRRTAYRFVSDYVSLRDKHQRIYVVHRLDEDTSGVLVFAKDSRLKDSLQLSWQNLVKKRGYYAIVEGKMRDHEGTLVNYLKKNKINLVYVTDDKVNGKKAVTHYKVINENKDYSLLNITIDTGRQNQIRVQLGHINHYVIGDDKYGEPSNPIHRLGLHAYLLEFTHPITHKVMRFNSPIPKEFKTLFPVK